MWVVLVMLVMSLVEGLQEPGDAPHCQDSRCRYVPSNAHHHSYMVDGKKLIIMYDSTTLQIFCFETSVLGSPALPRAEPALHVSQVVLRKCPPPTNSSLADALDALNVKPNSTNESFEKLILYQSPPSPPLAAKHFTGLERLLNLQILSMRKRTSPEHGFLSQLRSLRSLVMQNVALPTGELDTPSPLLRELELRYTRMERYPEALYSLTNLERLTIENETPFDAIAVPPRLVYLDLQSPATTLRLDTAPALVTLSMDHWTEPLPLALSRCSMLRLLQLMAPTMRALPDDWLANCSQLEKIVIQNALHLTDLPSKLLINTSALMQLVLRQGALERLPAGLLAGAPNLQSLELEGNHLQTLPSNTFMYQQSLLKLNLSFNDLDGDVMNRLVPLHKLTELDLAHNPRIGDICNARGFSSLISLKLTKLFLRGTGVTRICHDWRLYMKPLEKLDLSWTNITELSFNDLQFSREMKTNVLLLGAPVVTVRLTRDDFYKATSPGSLVVVHLNAALECDCRMYWTRRALEPSQNALDHVRQLRCASGGLLRELPLEDMVCARPQECAAAALPTACSCSVWADDDPDHDPLLVRVRCENASLSQVPHPHTPLNDSQRLYELLLAHNQISDLHAHDLQDNIKGLDLRNNSLVRVDEETAMKLGSVNGVLRLAGNPLECDCSAAPLLRALHNRSLAEPDRGEATCSDGSAIYEASYADCTPSGLHTESLIAWLVGVLAVILTLVVAIMALLASRERRFFVLAVLSRWGCVWRAAEPVEDKDRRYDAFLTFSHKDEAVVRELMTRLEPPYCLCMHYRDWIPGCFIAEQVVESVRESRRTVALVSKHFLASSWARAEFREAHTAAMLDARPRLIVVMLEEPATLPLDAQLKRYIKTNTYLRWGDPWFWDKLILALPPPRSATTQCPRVLRQLALPLLAEPAIELSPVGNQ